MLPVQYLVILDDYPRYCGRQGLKFMSSVVDLKAMQIGALTIFNTR